MEKGSSRINLPFSSRIQEGKPLEKYKGQKMLPHINEEYDFRITNRILIQKIINPRRDKTIMDSLARTTLGQFNKTKRQGMNKHPFGHYRRKNLATQDKKHRIEMKSGQSDFEQALSKDKSIERQQNSLDNFCEGIQKNNKTGCIIQRQFELTGQSNEEGHSKIIRNNFIGKIIRNRSNRTRQPPKRSSDLSNICFNLNLSNSQFFQNPSQPGQIKWNRKFRLSKRGHQSSSSLIKRQFNKQNAIQIDQNY